MKKIPPELKSYALFGFADWGGDHEMAFSLRDLVERLKVDGRTSRAYFTVRYQDRRRDDVTFELKDITHPASDAALVKALRAIGKRSMAEWGNPKSSGGFYRTCDVPSKRELEQWQSWARGAVSQADLKAARDTILRSLFTPDELDAFEWSLVSPG